MTQFSFSAFALVATLVSPTHAQVTGPLLAGIEDLYVQVVVDDVLLEAGVSASPIKSKVETELKAAGINIVEGGFPTLIVRVRGLLIRAGGRDFGYSLNLSLRVEDIFIPMRPAIGKNEISAVSYINASLVTSSLTEVSEMVDSAMDSHPERLPQPPPASELELGFRSAGMAMLEASTKVSFAPPCRCTNQL